MIDADVEFVSVVVDSGRVLDFDDAGDVVFAELVEELLVLEFALEVLVVVFSVVELDGRRVELDVRPVEVVERAVLLKVVRGEELVVGRMDELKVVRVLVLDDLRVEELRIEEVVVVLLAAKSGNLNMRGSGAYTGSIAAERTSTGRSNRSKP